MGVFKLLFTSFCPGEASRQYYFKRGMLGGSKAKTINSLL